MVQTSDSPSSLDTQRTHSVATFHNLLEQFVFNSENLNLVKTAIAKLISGEITEAQLKEQILFARISMMKEIVQLFIVYNTKHEKEKKSLTQQVAEYKELLTTIIPRLERLEQTLIPISSENNIKLDPELLEQKIEQAMTQIDIELWLKAFPLNQNKEKVRDDYRFVNQFFTAFGKYYDGQFNIENPQDVKNISRIEDLNFPLDLHDNLVKLLSIRISISHGFHILTSDDIELAYVTYFQLIFRLFKEALGDTVLELNRAQIKEYIKQLIEDQMNIDDYNLSIGIRELNKEF
ncbi:MAG: hypothetical protein ACFE9R_13800 [Candidatus Hermodarchaeota archaeon]